MLTLCVCRIYRSYLPSCIWVCSGEPAEMGGKIQSPASMCWCSHSGSAHRSAFCHVSQRHSTNWSLLFPLRLPTRLRSVPCQVDMRPWPSLRALFSSPGKDHNPNLSFSRHIWETNEKMKECAGWGPSVPNPDLSHTSRATEPLSPWHPGCPSLHLEQGTDLGPALCLLGPHMQMSP